MLSLKLCLLCLSAGQAHAQQLAPPPSAKPKLVTLPPHVPIMRWGHDSPWLQKLKEAQASATAPSQLGPDATEPKAEKRVIEVQSAPGSDQQAFSFRDITDRSKPRPEVLPMAERSRAVQELRRSLMGRPKSPGGAQQ